jgi:NIPSNAP
MWRIAIALTLLIGASMNVHASPKAPCCPVIELRQYTLKPGQRDVLIDLFDRYFIEAQESARMTIIGQFRDRTRPDRFVWMRGFSDMVGRHRALEQFYDGPVWAAHRTAANDTMLDSDDVLLLKPVRPELAFRLEEGAARTSDGPRGVLAGIYTLSEPATDSLVAQFERNVAPQLRARGIDIEGLFVSESAPNTFTRLPVREGEHVLMWVGTLKVKALAQEELDEVRSVSALNRVGATPTLLNLEPTPRSRLGDGVHAARATKHDFDFLHGSWNVHNHYLKERLKHSTDWIEFDARSDVEPLLNGLGQLDRYSAVRDGSPVEGITLRLFNPATGEWSLHWADTVRAGVLLPPMVGRFKGNVGEFFGDETVDGKPVLCRFHWTRTPDGSPHWEQALSDDGGKTWEINGIMTFTRR